MHAAATHGPLLARQEVSRERFDVIGLTQRVKASRDSFTPGRDRRDPKRSMANSVITKDLEREPLLQLVERHRRIGQGVVIAARLDVAEGRPGQKMSGTHHRPNQPLDVAAIVRRRNRTVDQGNPKFLRAPLQRARAKLLAVVDMNSFRKPCRRPVAVDAEPGKISLLRQHQALDRQRDRGH